jgi:hypothetical protein
MFHTGYSVSFMSKQDGEILQKLVQLADGDPDLVADAMRASQKPRYRQSFWEMLSRQPGTVYTGHSARIEDVIDYIEKHR